MHPAHVPLVREAKSAFLNGMRDLRPCRGFLSDEHRVRIVLADRGIELLEELDSLEVLIAAVLVGNVLSAAVVAVKH